jgi:SAM-dependent methyltransferase
MSIVDIYPPATVWEAAATTRWGRYTTQVVEDAVRIGAELAGPPRSACEIGCEGGRWSRLLAAAGWTMTCTDIDPHALAICHQRVPTAHCVLVSSESTTLPCTSETINLLVCLEVFPVIESEWFPREAIRALAPGGVLVGVAQNAMSLRGVFVRARQFLTRDPKRFYNLSYAELRQRLRTSGFDFILERGYCWFPLSRESNSALTALFIRLERLLRFDRQTAISPWVIFIAKKRDA